MSHEKDDPAGLAAVRRAFAKHVMLASRLQDSRPEALGFVTSKGTIHFPTDKPLSNALVRKLVKARLAQIESKVRR